MRKATANILKGPTRTIKTSIINRVIMTNIMIKAMATMINNTTAEVMDTMMNR